MSASAPSAPRAWASRRSCSRPRPMPSWWWWWWWWSSSRRRRSPRALRPPGARPGRKELASSGGDRSESALEQRRGNLELVRVAGQRRRILERALEQPRNRRHACERHARRPAAPHGGDPGERESEALAVHRLQVDRCVRGLDVELQKNLPRFEGRRAGIAGDGHLVEGLDRKLAPARPNGRAEGDQRGGDIGRMGGGTELVREDRALAMLAFARMAAVAAVEPAGVAKPPVVAT